mmetsp:Transcript_6525/g.19391  ORF Transcript_6525/g.19391 Transcript_6525/m.19391 type:complete len:202 (+) Transcript_6525:1219-1824(+)
MTSPFATWRFGNPKPLRNHPLNQIRNTGHRARSMRTRGVISLRTSLSSRSWSELALSPRRHLQPHHGKHRSACWVGGCRRAAAISRPARPTPASGTARQLGCACSSPARSRCAAFPSASRRSPPSGRRNSSATMPRAARTSPVRPASWRSWALSPSTTSGPYRSRGPPPAPESPARTSPAAHCRACSSTIQLGVPRPIGLC